MLIFWNQQCNIVSVAEDGSEDVMFIVMDKFGRMKKEGIYAMLGYRINNLYITRNMMKKFVLTEFGHAMLPCFFPFDNCVHYTDGLWFNNNFKTMEI